MPETEIKMTPFVGCTYLYQAVMKLMEETGEVAQAFYNLDSTDASKLDIEDVDKLAEECGDVMQAAFNLINWLHYDAQEVIDKVTEKNIARGYYDAK